MGLFSGLKNILGQINKIDVSISDKGRNFADVYAQNLALEEEIAARTKELEQANQTILTLNTVWEMMNASEPLSSMLDKIVTILNEDMNYTSASIFQLKKDSQDEYFLQYKASSSNRNINKLFAIVGAEKDSYQLQYLENSIIAKAINERKILSTPDIKGMVKIFFPSIEEKKMLDILSVRTSKICTVVPLHSEKENFGCLLVTSDREEITDTEINFLGLYANQIGLAITVAGLFEEVKKQAITDPLTGIYNRRYFEDNIIKEAERALRLKQPFSVISMDLDYLKKINDTYGHQYGDLAIRTIANVLKKEARSIDIPARIGGEEFNLLLPGVDSKGALVAAERIRKSIESQVLDTIVGITASIGVATFLEHSDRVDELIELADQAMYRAKVNGRNQVQLAQSDQEIDWQQIAIDTFIDILSMKRIPINEDISQMLYQKLQKVQDNEKNKKDTLYSIVDTISQTYNRMYKTGTTKSKEILAVLLAKKLELSKEEIDKLKLAILLYDIGNIMIPEEIFNKKEPLTEEERKLIKQHPLIAAREILQPISNIQDIIPIIENHHENWNGEGYPDKKAGIEIPITSQIVLLVDSFYAMLQDRPYRHAYSVDEIIDIIKNEKDKSWNKKLVEDFIYVVKNEQLQ